MRFAPYASLLMLALCDASFADGNSADGNNVMEIGQ